MTGSAHTISFEAGQENVVLAYERVIAPTIGQGKRALTTEEFLIVEALFLRLMVEAEIALDEFYWGVLAGEFVVDPEYTPVQIFTSRSIAVQVTTEKGYIGWLPQRDISKKTDRFFKAKNPVARTGVADPDLLSQSTKIRNYIAHRSVESLEQLRPFVPAASMPTDRRTSVGPFLLSRHTTSQSKFEAYSEQISAWVMAALAD